MENKNKFNTQMAGDSAYLLTPGPLTTSATVKQAMLRDLGSRDNTFIELNAGIRKSLLNIADAQGSHVCVPLQGSGTFIVEAMLANLLAKTDKLLNLVNGAYGHRISSICQYLQRDVVVQEWSEDKPVDVAALEKILADDDAITHVAVVYCETTSGLVNPLQDIARVTKQQGRSLLIDAMSAFGALPLSSKDLPFTALAASSNKCLQGVPGLGFCLVEQQVLKNSQGNAHSLSLDLYQQWQAMEKNGQWRFTPPTHCLLAFEQALREFEQEGGQAGRYARYRDNCRILVEGMRGLGFKTLLPDELQAPIIVTFHMPTDPAFVFQDFYDRLSGEGYIIYPGKLTKVDSFRVGCIGDLGADEMHGFIAAVKKVAGEMGVTNCSPAD